MPPRSVLKPKQGRPVSAVFIGNGAGSTSGSQEPLHSPQLSTFSSPQLPELPEPPSPSSSIRSIGSGLPSPPATNSTGSGSTGDPATIAIRSRPLSHDGNSSTSTSSGSHTTPMRSTSDAPSRSSSRLSDNRRDDSGADADFDGDYDKENDNDNESNLDGDHTARLDRKLHGGITSGTLTSRSSSENQAVLQRAKSLAQRNRLAMDKLSRLGSPSPARSGTPNSRSPAPSQAGSSRSQAVRTARSSAQVSQRHESIRSGSETERESTYQTNSTHSSSSHSHSLSSIRRTISHSSRSRRSTTPPSRQLPEESPHSSTYHHHLPISASDSPHKPRPLTAPLSPDLNPSHNPSNRRGNRASVASVQLTYFEEEDDGATQSDRRTASASGIGREKKDRTLSEAETIMQSALAAVASARRSPLGHRRRSALPREFRSDLAEDSPTGSFENRTTDGGRYENQQERQEVKTKTASGPFTPFRSAPNGPSRSSTVRERRAVTGRWPSDDYRTPATLRTRPFNTSYSNEDGNPRKERRQSVRGGSIENSLWSPGGRSLISEGLRAAGLTRRRDEESRGAARGHLTNGRANGDVFKERVRKVDWSPQDMIDDGSRRPLVDKEHDRSVPPRASTSMAQYQYMDNESPASPRDYEEPHLRGHRSTYSLISRDRDRDSIVGGRATSALGRSTPRNITGTPRLAVVHLQERLATASPFGSRRYIGQPPLTPQTEHARLMLDSLTMFETSLAKLPRTATHNIGTNASSAHTDVLQNAQGMVFAADRLYNLLKQGSSRAIEAQVEAEVESTTSDSHVRDIVELWGKVASDYREGSRMTDDLIRGITGILLGMGRVMREFAVDRGVSEYGSPSMHGRHASLGDDLRRTSPDVTIQSGGRHSEDSSDRQSTISRHSWDASKDRDKEREEALKRLAGGSNGESVLARASPATFQRLKNHESSDHRHRFETPSPATNGRSKSQPMAANSVRRTSTPRDIDTKVGLTLRGPSIIAVNSQETVQPSPTPAPRQRGSPAVDRPRNLPPLSIPRPLPTLPSETLLRRAAEKFVDNEHSTATRDRRRNLRGSERPFPSLTSPANPTIALTPHTVSNAERFPTAIQRTDSGKSAPSQVTFSRPTAVSVSKSLSELQQADGERKRSLSITKADSGGFYPSNQNQGLPDLEIERDAKRKTFGVAKARMSLDDAAIGVVGDPRTSTSHAADRSAATTILTTTTVKRERRRTVTDIWPR